MSITWLFPAAVAGLLLAAIPIAIHLLVRQQSRRVPFPSLRFLHASRLASVKRRTLQDAALLACRVAIISAAVLAMAAPVFMTDGRRVEAASRIARAVVVAGEFDQSNSAGTGVVPAEVPSAFRLRVFRRANLSDAVADALRWLGEQPPARRELVIASAFQRGAVSRSDLALVPEGVGIRLVQTDAAERPRDVEFPILTRRDDRLVLLTRRVHLDDHETRQRDGEVRTIASLPIRIIAMPRDQTLADAALAAVLDVGVRWPVLDRQLVVLWPGTTGTPPDVSPGALVVKMDELSTDAASADALLAAVTTAIAAPTDTLEPVRLSRSELSTWERPSGPPSASALPIDEGDRRWLWLTALVLLALEQLLRYRIAVRKTIRQPARSGALPEQAIQHRLRETLIRLRVEGLLWSLAAGAALSGALVLIAGSPVAPTAGALLALVLAYRSWTRWTEESAASEIERRLGSLDNLLITAAELLNRPRTVRSPVREEILRQAATRVAAVDLKAAVPLGRAAVVAMAVGTGAIATVWSSSHLPIAAGDRLQAETPNTAASLPSVTLFIEPPPYTGLPKLSLENPVQATAIAGSRVRLESPIALDAASVTVLPFALTQQGSGFVAEWTAREPISFTLRRHGAPETDARFLTLQVTPDVSPSIRLTSPGKDLALTDAATIVVVDTDATDDLGLGSIELKYTRASGTGESLSFSEGTVPLDVTHTDGRHWTGRLRWPLASLKLEDGDVIVYRAVARDRNPQGTPGQSGSFLIEIGRQSSGLAEGFAISTDEKRYAISQQMVIYKTEQLLARAAEHRADWLEQTQALAIEQRMVRSEVVFLGGGEIEDEEVEAANSDELSEGRLRNTGRAEMLRAITSMSRAETALNGGDARQALLHERAALQALERAFDRRRYFLRTIPDRSKIDLSRRLSGTLTDARSWLQTPNPAPVAPSLAAARGLMVDLVGAASASARSDAGLASRLAALDPESPSLRAAAVALATAQNADARALALSQAMDAVRSIAQSALSDPSSTDMKADPL